MLQTRVCIMWAATNSYNVLRRHIFRLVRDSHQRQDFCRRTSAATTEDLHGGLA